MLSKRPLAEGAAVILPVLALLFRRLPDYECKPITFWNNNRNPFFAWLYNDFFFYRLSCLVVIRGISKGNPIKINCLLIIYKLQNILVYGYAQIYTSEGSRDSFGNCSSAFRRVKKSRPRLLGR